MNALKKFATKKGYTYIDQLELAGAAASEESRKVGYKTARKNSANLKTFFAFCIDQSGSRLVFIALSQQLGCTVT